MSGADLLRGSVLSETCLSSHLVPFVLVVFELFSYVEVNDLYVFFAA